MGYTGTVDLISGIRQKNGGKFPLVDASAVRMTDDSRLNDYLNPSENPEYIRLITDEENNFLWGIRQDGSVDWAKGIPMPVRKALTILENALKVQEEKENGDQEAVREKIAANEAAIQAINTLLENAVVYCDSVEFLRVYTDEAGSFLWGIRRDGTIDWARGIPKPIQEQMEKLRDSMEADVQKNLSGLMGSLDEINAYLKENVGYSENPEYLRAYTDAGGRFLWGIKADGDVLFGKGVPEQIQTAINAIGYLAENPEYLQVVIDGNSRPLEAMDAEGRKTFYTDVLIHGIFTADRMRFTRQNLDDIVAALRAMGIASTGEFVDDPEYLRVYTDEAGRILEATTAEGQKRFFSDVDIRGTLKVKQFDFSEENISEIEAALSAAGFKAEVPVDWSKTSSLQIPIPRCAMVNISNVKSMPTSKTADEKAILEFWDMQGNYFKKNVILNAQGNSSLGFVKKNFAVDLCNDEWEGNDTFSIRFGEWVAQDSFHVKAYYTDFFRGVAVVSYQIYDEILRTRGVMKDRPWKKELIAMDSIGSQTQSFQGLSDMSLQLDTGARCFPDGFPCIVYLNGAFYGVFSWQLKKHRDNMHQTKDVAEHLHLDGTISTTTLLAGNIDWTAFEVRNPKSLYCMDGTEYEADTNQKELIDETSEFYSLATDSSKVKKRKQMTAKVKKYIVSLSTAMSEVQAAAAVYEAEKTDENLAALKKVYETYFDVENQIDYLIASDAVKNSDGFAKNWQWTSYNGEKWYLNMYDVDMSFGGHFQGNQTTAPLKGHISTTKALPSYYVEKYYQAELEARYAQLRKAGIIDADHFIGLLEDWTKRIGYANYQKEFEKWPDCPCNGDNVVNQEFWELVTDENGIPVTEKDLTYDMAVSYQVGDTCSYGVSAAMGYFQFQCVAAVKSIAPIKTFRHRDNLYRVKRWMDTELKNMDSVYHYDN